MFLEKQRYEKELEDTVIKKEEQFAFTKGADERVTMDRDGMVKEIAEKLNHTFNDLRFNLIEMDPKYEKKNIVYKKKNFYDSRDLDLNTTWNNLLSQIMESSILKEPIKLDAIRLLANEYNFSEYAKRSAEDYMTELPGRNLKSEFDNILRSSIEHDGLYNDFIRVSNRWKSKRDHIADRKFDRMQTYTRTLMRLFNSTKTDRADIIRTATPEMRRSAKGYGFVEAVKTWRKLNNNSEEVKLPESVVELFESGQISSILRNAKIYSWETMLKSGKLTRAKAEEFLRAKSRYESTEYTLKRNPNTKEESIELKPTGYIEGYWPHMDWDPKVLEAQRDAAIEQVKGSTLSNSAKGEKIQRINEHFSHLRAVDQAPDMMLNIAEANMITNRDAILEKSVRQAKQLDLTAAIERKPGAAMKRTADLDGFSYRYDVIEKYIRQINKAIYTKAGGMLARRTIESFEQKAPMGEQTQNWGDYFRIYARDVLGYPSLIPEHIYSAKKGEPLHDPLNLKYAPYRVLSDENVMNFGTPKVGKDGEPVYDRNGIQKYEGGSKLNKVFTKLYGWKARVTRQERRDFKKKNGRDMTQEEIEAVYKERMADFQPADIAAISNLESKYEMASLLAHSKTGLNNILGGTANTWIWSGSKHLWNSWKMDELRKINREWKNMDDVHRTLSEWGVIEEMMVHELNLHKEFSIPKYRRFADDVLDYLKRDPNASDKTLMQIAKDNNISQSFMDKAAWFMRKSERVLRSRAFLASYMQAREQLLPVVLEYNNDYLIQRGKEGVKATQFLYTASYRPAFARTSAGKIFSRLKLWGWNSMKFRREVYQAAKFTGMNPNTEEFERFQRMLFSDSLMIGLASLIPFSMFDYGLPSPYSQMQAFGQWLFGATDEEKSRAFYGELPTAIAPLSEVVPVILRTPVNLFSALFTSDNWVQTANYYIWASFPFGRIGKDVWRSMQNPIMLPEHMTGIPFRRLQYLSKQYKDKKFRSYTPFYNPLEQEEEEE
jgi:hypothetical protein